MILVTIVEIVHNMMELNLMEFIPFLFIQCSYPLIWVYGRTILLFVKQSPYHSVCFNEMKSSITQ